MSQFLRRLSRTGSAQENITPNDRAKNLNDTDLLFPGLVYVRTNISTSREESSNRIRSRFQKPSRTKAGSRNFDSAMKVHERSVETGIDRGRPLSELYFLIPEELQVQILLELPIETILACRQASRSFDELIRANQASICRVCVFEKLPRYCIRCWPEPPSNCIPFMYCLIRQYNICVNLSQSLTSYIKEELLRGYGKSILQAFVKEELRVQEMMLPFLFIIFYFYESTDGGIDMWSSVSLDSIWMAVVGHNRFVFQTLTRRLRPPSYMTLAERTLRGMGGYHPVDPEVMFALIDHGLNSANQVLRLSELSARVKRFYGLIYKAYRGNSEQPDWRTEWAKFTYHPCERQTRVSVSALFDYARARAAVEQASPAPAKEDQERDDRLRRFWYAPSFVSALLGCNVTTGRADNDVYEDHKFVNKLLFELTGEEKWRDRSLGLDVVISPSMDEDGEVGFAGG